MIEQAMISAMLAGMRILGGILVVLWGSGALAETVPTPPAPGTRTQEAPAAAIPQTTAPLPLRPHDRIPSLLEAAKFEARRRPAGGRAPAPPLRPMARDAYLPAAQWDTEPRGALWTRSMMSALTGHGREVVDTVPRDIADWCPAYVRNDPDRRAAFWVGLMSAIAHYESRYRPAVVGAGSYFGLLQIYPPTARSVDCRAETGEALKLGTANLSCAVRIMAEVVADHRAIAMRSDGWLGIANQWGPMTRSSVRADMAAWTRQQDYCQTPPLASPPRPTARPADVVRSEARADGSPAPG